MTIYVDFIFEHTPRDKATRRNGTRWSHMMVDRDTPVEELHKFAASLGLKREWFQNNPSLPHYDITPPKHRQALRKGAVLVSSKELVQLCKRVTKDSVSPGGDPDPAGPPPNVDAEGDIYREVYSRIIRSHQGGGDE